MPQLSIIVPLFRTECFLPRCIDSILAQTFADFELILVDDGSSDRCGEICEEYVLRDDRVIVVHQDNLGVSAARNAGLDIARGGFVGFVDSDDWIEQDFYEKMIETAKKEKCDVVICAIKNYGSAGYLGIDQNYDFSSNEDAILSLLYEMPMRIGGGLVNKVFSSQAIANNRFDREETVGEDWLFLFDVFRDCKKLVMKPLPFYCVYCRASGNLSDMSSVSSLRGAVRSSKKMLIKAKRTGRKSLIAVATEKYADDCIRFSRYLREIDGMISKLIFVQMRRKALSTAIAFRLNGVLPSAPFHRIMFEVFHE